jgi:putative membrane protein
VPNPWRFELHPEVLVLVAFLIGSYTYMVRSIGPAAVGVGERPVTRRNVWSFVAAMAMLLAASWWPLHDIGEQYLYSAHMLQHMMLSYFLPPLVWLATPEWLLRALIGQHHIYGAVRWLCHPVVAAVAFNLAVMVTHIPGVVNGSVDSGALHYALHVMVVTTSLLMWMPVCGPIPEFRIGTAPAMIYLFLQSVVPTVPAAWLTFAEGAVYHRYGEQRLRLWGVSVTSDQQLAGAIMKTGGSIFLWTIIVTLWFKRFSASYRNEHDYKRRPPLPGAAPDVLTYQDVEREFAQTAAPREP